MIVLPSKYQMFSRNDVGIEVIRRSHIEEQMPGNACWTAKALRYISVGVQDCFVSITKVLQI